MAKPAAMAFIAAMTMSGFAVHGTGLAQMTEAAGGADAMASDIVANSNAAAAAFDAAHPGAEPTSTDIAIAGLWSLDRQLRQEHQIDSADTVIAAIGILTNSGEGGGSPISKAAGISR